MNAQPPRFDPQRSYDPYSPTPTYQAPTQGYATAAQVAAGGHPAYSGQPQTPPRPKRGPAEPILSVLAFLLAIGVAVMVTQALGAQSQLDKDISAQQDQVALDAQDTVVPGTLVKPNLDQTALRAKLAAVKTFDTAVDTAINNWNKGGLKFKVVVEGIDACFYAVSNYDVVAAPFSANELGDLPAKIDLNDGVTDCGRSSLSKISGRLA